MTAPAKVVRNTVDLSAYPDLIVIYLGMRVTAPRGLPTLLRLGPQIGRAVAARPDGLLLHENLMFSLWPLHIGMRQYWRDLGAMERWTRELPHKSWWTDFLRDPGGTAFWHETYSRNGGVEAIYDAEEAFGSGLAAFSPLVPAKGRLFSARGRLKPDTADQSAWSGDQDEVQVKLDAALGSPPR